MSYYLESVSRHFLHPRHVGDVADADTVAETGSFTCGAVVRLSLKVDPETQRITDAGFKAVGCGYLIAAASLMMEITLGLRCAEAAAMAERFPERVAEEFGLLPPERQHCAALCGEALHEAITRYSQLMREEWTGDDALICTCFGVSEKRIERAISEKNLRTVREVTRACNAGGGCHSCHPLIEEMLTDYRRTAGKSLETET